MRRCSISAAGLGILRRYMLKSRRERTSAYDTHRMRLRLVILPVAIEMIFLCRLESIYSAKSPSDIVTLVFLTAK